MLYSMHPQPIPTIDEWIATNVFRRKRFIEIRLIAEIEFRDTSFRYDTAVICLSKRSGKSLMH